MKSVEGDGYVLLEDIAYTSEDSRENSQSYREAKHSLDLYLPCANKSDAQSVTQSAQSAIDHGARGLVVGEAAGRPVVIFVHGGGWKRGDRRNWDHFLYCDVNFMAAFLFWMHNFHRNIGEAYAKRGIPCLLMSYSLTRMSFPWILGEVVASYIGSVVFTGIILGVGFVPWFLSTWTCKPLIFEIAPEVSNCWHFAFQVFVIHLFISNFIILTFITIKRAKFGLSALTIAFVWLSIILTFSAKNQFPGKYGFMLLFVETLFIPQGLILYRLLAHPQMDHKQQASDVAKCMKWARQFGSTSRLYNEDDLFLMGHSAGGHLVSLLTLDERYLLSEGLSSSNIKGVISVSGVYDLLNLNWGIWKYVYLHPTFGHDPQCWKEASPLHRLETHRNSPTPPFLILCAKLDLHLRKESKIFQQSLRDAGVSCDRFLMEKTNHFSIIYHLERNLGEDKSLMEHCFSFISFNCEVTGK